MELKNKTESKLQLDIISSEESIDSMDDKILMYEEHIKEKDKLICELKDELQNERNKVESYKIRVESINDRYSKFQEYKDRPN
mgnify:CR=1 FL=1